MTLAIKMRITEYKKRRTTTEIGNDIEIPGQSVGITVTKLLAFDNTVQVSWLEPENKDSKGIVNNYTVHEIRTDYKDNSAVEIPYAAAAMNIDEPISSTDSTVYYLY